MLRPWLILVLVLLGGCGEQGSYELHWTLSCSKPPANACPITSARDCSKAGLDALEVLVTRSPTDTPIRTQFACFTLGEGAVGRGPGLDPGQLNLQVYGISPGGQRLIGPVQAGALIPESGLERVEVNLPLPPACGDGVDNDGDGLVDLHDTGCRDAADTSED